MSPGVSTSYGWRSMFPLRTQGGHRLSVQEHDVYGKVLIWQQIDAWVCVVQTEHGVSTGTGATRLKAEIDSGLKDSKGHMVR